MPRQILNETHIHPAIREKVSSHNTEIVREVQSAISDHAVVVVGMGLNPVPKKARVALDTAKISYHYMEYGSYLKDWRLRNALKMWTGWPTFPMVFVKGCLVGGYADLKALMDSGELHTLLAN